MSVGAQSDLTADAFGQITSRLSRERLPGATGVAFVASADDAHVADVQARWRAGARRGSASIRSGRAGSTRS